MKTCKKTTGLVIVLICAMLITMFSLAGCQNTGTQNDTPTTEPTQETTLPDVTEPPATEPPATEPPATEPPATEPPATEPPATEPPATEPKKTNEEIAREVIDGLWGNGLARKNRLTAAGYDYNAVQKIVNELMPDLGERLNPEIIKELGSITMQMKANQKYGYYYSWTAEEDGYITVFFTNLPAGIEGEIYMRNLTTDELVQLTEDGVDNYGLELSIDVKAGDTVYIQLLTQPGADGKRPAAEITWASVFSYPKGSELNPIYPEFAWNNDGTEATATTKVPAGETYHYSVYGAAGMLLSIDGGEPVLLTAEGMGRAPCNFTVKNDGTAAKEFTLKLTYPEGHYMKPLVLEELNYTSTDLKLEANDNDGFYYVYTAPEDGTVTFYITSIAENVEADIVVLNGYTQKTLLADGVDNYGLELTVDVKKGDELLIQVVVMPDATWNRPAAEIKWFGNFTYYAGHEQNPIFPEFQWNNEYTEATATVKVPAGKTYHYGAYGASGMLLSIDGAEPTVLTAQGMGRAPAYFTITNDGTADKEYALKLSHPVGTMMNPETLDELGWIGLLLPEADMYSQGNGYYYTYTVPADGFVNFYTGMIDPYGVVANIIVTNERTYEQKSLILDGVDEILTMDVSAGDVLNIMVATEMDIATYTFPAADMEWYGEFKYPLGTEQNPIDIEWDYNDEYSQATATVKVPAGKTQYFNGTAGMLLSIDGAEGVLMTGDFWNCSFSITNETDAEKEYSLEIYYPVGSMMNPEVITSIDNLFAQIPAGGDGEYYFVWTATDTGKLTITFVESSVAVGNYDIRISGDMNLSNPWMTDVEGATSVTFDTTKGEQVKICLVAVSDTESGTIKATGSLAPVQITQIYMPGMIPTTLELAAGETQYFLLPNGVVGYTMHMTGDNACIYLNGAKCTDWMGEGKVTVILEGLPAYYGAPLVGFCNNSEETATYTISLELIVGTIDNPEAAAEGVNTAVIEEGSDGYYYKWTATEAGTLTVTMPTTGDWFFVVNNVTDGIYGDGHYSDSDPLVNSEEVIVEAGDEIMITVNTYDPNNWWGAPAGLIEVTLSFTAAE